jgi:hypothetical protein
VLLFKAALDVKGLGSHLYFSYQVDVATSMQAAELAAAGQLAGPSSAKAVWGAADGDYAWNAHIAQPVISAGGAAFVPPLISGFVAQVRGGGGVCCGGRTSGLLLHERTFRGHVGTL